MSLRERTLKGGMFLAGRQIVGILFRLVAVFVITRIIGPYQYGLSAACLGIFMYVQSFATWGIDVYLIRKPQDLSKEELDQAFTLLLLISFSCCFAMYVFRGALAGAVRMPEVKSMFGVLALTIPFSLIHLPAMVQLDRALDFKRVAINELFSQTLQYVVAVPLAYAGTGAWSLVLGFVASNVALCVLTYRATQLRPRLHWNRALIRQMIGYGLSYSSSIWVWQLRSLVNPVLVGRFAGAEGVGYVGLAIRICEVLSFVRSAAWRIAMATLAKLSGDAERLRRSITEGMRLQTLAVGLPLAGFAIIAPYVMPRAFGVRWDPTMKVYPFIALGYLASSVFNLHSSVLYLLRRNWSVTEFHAVHVLLFAVAAALLVPRMGILGYGWAEVVALASYVLLHYFIQQQIGSPSYGMGAIWCGTAACVLVLSAFGDPAVYFGPIVLLLPLIFPRERSSLHGYAQILFSRTGA
jgi:O-antigen/teichoic acid export membrane protein